MPVVAPLLATSEGVAARVRAAEEARSRDTTLHLVAFVANPDKAGAAERYPSDRAATTSELEREVATLEEQGVRAEGHLPTGISRLSAAVLEVADQVGAQLIVIGIRRRSRVGKLVMGSDAQDILLNADCEVLTVKAPSDD